MNTNQIPPIPPAAAQANPGSNHSTGMKILFIGILAVVLVIPMLFVYALISERENRQREAVAEVRQSWSGSQILAGPSLTIPYSYQNSEGKWTTGHVNYLPETLEISGALQTQQLRRGIYDIVVYDAPVTLSGTFAANDLRALRANLDNLRPADATLNIGISDLRGICEQVDIRWGDTTVPANPGTSPHSLATSGISIPADATPLLRPDGSVPFSVTLHLRGSAHLFFAPLGRVTKASLTSDCPSPSFTGAFLPREREVSDTGFSAEWQVLELNRNYPQAIVGGQKFSNYHNDPNLSLPVDMDYADVSETIHPSLFGVSLLLPVDQYQQTTRAAKYAFLVIILTFVICFFTEVFQRRNIHPAQYLLVGLALCLFYTLLLATAEHTGFALAYALASVMTVGLITFYLSGVLRIRRTALVIGGLLACLYAYVFLLIRMETYALLAGSLGLFAILAVVMYFSQKIKWQ